MKVITSINEMKSLVKSWKSQGLNIGFVPTMGYLHDGHMSLIKKSVEDNQRTVVSIFVNPIQFGAGEDLEEYPRDMKGDTKACKQADVDVIFSPLVSEMYQKDFYTYVDMNTITESLCGASRAGFFKGVCTVVLKLFNIVTPDKSYFGEKDAQQLAVIKNMVKDLNMDVEVIGLPTVREESGLAMSSRNSYLNLEEKEAALCLYDALNQANILFKKGVRSTKSIIESISQALSVQPLAKVDYIEVVDYESLKPIMEIQKPALCAIALYVGETRLIDNTVLWI